MAAPFRSNLTCQGLSPSTAAGSPANKAGPLPSSYRKGARGRGNRELQGNSSSPPHNPVFFLNWIKQGKWGMGEKTVLPHPHFPFILGESRFHFLCLLKFEILRESKGSEQPEDSQIGGRELRPLEEGLSPHNLSLALDRKVTAEQWV